MRLKNIRKKKRKKKKSNKITYDGLGVLSYTQLKE